MRLIFDGTIAMELEADYYPERKPEESEVFIQVPANWIGRKVICILEKKNE